MIIDITFCHKTTEEGGRIAPIFSGYRPTWHIGRFYQGQRWLFDGQLAVVNAESIAPCECGTGRIQVMSPEYWYHLKVGDRIEMGEGPRVIAVAMITAITGQMDEITARETCVRRHRRRLADAVEWWQGSTQTLDALGNLTREVKVLYAELEKEAAPAWVDKLGDSWGELETIYAVRLDGDGELSDEERRDIARTVGMIYQLASEGRI